MSAMIQLSGVGKFYKRYASHRDKWIDLLSLGHIRRYQPQWVLHDIDLEVRPGEAVGLIGYNGAGKSTLLKLIAGTATPSTGSVHVAGRMAALLELGIGFHPEFTGRQNINLAGKLLGYRDAETAEVEQSVLEFAELGPWIDEPLRTYSSGMQARLAFSIATAIRPDILIVDEVLSVGDAYFQHKSFARIRDFRHAGTTLLFVSHDPGAIRALCDRAILLQAGTKRMDAAPGDVLDYYHALVLETERKAGIVQQDTGPAKSTRSGSGEVRLERLELLGSDANPRNILHCGEAATIRLHCKVARPVPALVAGIMLRDKLGNPIFGINSHNLGLTLAQLEASEEIVLEFALNLDLGPGSYSLSYGLTDSGVALRKSYDWGDGALVFELINRHYPTSVGTSLLRVTLAHSRQAPAPGTRASG